MVDLATMGDEEFAALIRAMRVAGTDVATCEVKTARAELPRDIGATISAFANGAGGLIVCGLSEKSGFRPVEGFDAPRIQDALAHWCSEKMTPPVHALIETRLFEGAPVVTAYVPPLRPKDKPCFVTASGRYMGSYVRVADGDRRLTSYEVDRFMDEHEQPRFDERVVDEASPADLDPSLVRGLLERERLVHARNFALLDDETALCKLRVLKTGEDGCLHPTLAGLVALGTYPQEFFPRLCVAFTCYPGTEKGELAADGRRFLDAQTFVGSISAMVQDAMAAVARNTRVGARVEGAFRRDVFDYPPVALREALVNALMHRDYSDEALGTPVAVDLYADRIEITNPGGLYGCATLRALDSAVIASARNQRLATILESTPLAGAGFVAENRGTGYQTIVRELAEAGMPAPVPRDTPAVFSLTMRRGIDGAGAGGGENPTEAPHRRTVRSEDIVVANGIEERGRYQTELCGMIVEVIELRGTASMAELVEESGRSRPTVLKALRELIDRGVVCATQKKNSPRQRYRLAGR